MQATLVRELAELRALERDWRNLPSNSPMMSPTWLLAWWQVRRSLPGRRDDSLFCIAVRDDDGHLRAIAPWYLARGRFNRHIIRFLADGKVCSDHLTIQTQSGWEHRTATCLVDFLFARHLRSAWDALDLEGVDCDDAAMLAFVEQLRRRDGALVHSESATGTWYLNLPGDWTEYLDGLSKNRRKRLRRLGRAYFESGKVSYQRAENPAQCQPRFDTLVDLHNRRRNDLGEAGAFQDAAFETFHRKVVGQLHSENRLWLSVLELEGQPIAAEYLLRDDKTLFAYQSGLDPAAMEHSPGTLSLMATIERAIRDGYRRFDFLRGDEAYKANWGAVERPAARIRVQRRDLAGRVLHVSERTARRVLRRRRPLRPN